LQQHCQKLTSSFIAPPGIHCFPKTVQASL
jgi:hypothetical protein